MPSNKYYKKYIRIPPNESIDIRRIMSIINHPLFQRLLHISQLGTTITVFPGATHNRFEHALGVYYKTNLFCKRLLSDGFITAKEAKNVALFGLLHDIGHGPFSHVIEEIAPFSHDRNGVRIMAQLKEEIEKSGGDFNLIKKMFKRTSPLYKIVMDKNIGMDKLDYLDRDTFHTGFGQRPDIETLLNYLSFIKGNLVIDKKSLEAAKQMQRLYIYMYKEVYLHKSALISQRFMQKMVSAWMLKSGVKPGELWMMDDNELIAGLATSKDPKIKFLYQSYKTRNLPRTGLVIRLKEKRGGERIAGKKINVIEEDSEFFNKFSKRANAKDLEAMEKLIGNELGVEAHRIVVVPTLTPWRFAPEDILYHDNGTIYSLKATFKEYFEALKLELADYLAVRVCIVGDRKLIFKNSPKIIQILKKHIG